MTFKSQLPCICFYRFQCKLQTSNDKEKKSIKQSIRILKKYQNPKKVIPIENKVFSTVDKNSIEANTANASYKGKGKIFEFYTNLHYL